MCKQVWQLFCMSLFVLTLLGTLDIPKFIYWYLEPRYSTNLMYKNDIIAHFVSSIRFYKKFKTCSNEENIFPFQITDSKFVFMYFHLYPILTVNQNLLYDLNCREDFVTSYTIKLKYKNVIRFFKKAEWYIERNRERGRKTRHIWQNIDIIIKFLIVFHSF